MNNERTLILNGGWLKYKQIFIKEGNLPQKP